MLGVCCGLRFTTDQLGCFESKEHGRFNATIVSISPDDVSDFAVC